MALAMVSNFNLILIEMNSPKLFTLQVILLFCAAGALADEMTADEQHYR